MFSGRILFCIVTNRFDNGIVLWTMGYSRSRSVKNNKLYKTFSVCAKKWENHRLPPQKYLRGPWETRDTENKPSWGGQAIFVDVPWRSCYKINEGTGTGRPRITVNIFILNYFWIIPLSKMKKQRVGCFSIDLPFTSASFNHAYSAQDPGFQARYWLFCHGMTASNMVHNIPKNIFWQCFEYKKSTEVRNKPGESRRRSQTASIESLRWANSHRNLWPWDNKILANLSKGGRMLHILNEQTRAAFENSATRWARRWVGLSLVRFLTILDSDPAHHIL